jgi:lysyl-tRNA synthetase class II
VAVAGRIMARRVFGKLAFFTLQDNTGVIQLYIDKGRLGEEFNVSQSVMLLYFLIRNYTHAVQCTTSLP